MGKIEHKEIEDEIELDKDIIRNAEGKRLKQDKIHVPDNYKVVK